MNKILITGAAGFVGFHLSQRLLLAGEQVIGLDNLNDYYDVSLKKARLEKLNSHSDFQFAKVDLFNNTDLAALFQQHQPTTVVHLAAQAGVRYSLTHPHAYADSNLSGFLNILEACRHAAVDHLVFASSSSVYGANRKVPFSVDDRVDHPVSLYAATKKANELMAHSYSHLYGIPTTGLRFFTVYGPWGRPDMAYFSFTKAIFEGQPIKVFNHGHMRRDFTYIDDIVEGIVRVMAQPPAKKQPDPSALDGAASTAPYKIYNIGNNQPTSLIDFMKILEAHIGRKAEKEWLPMQPGDVLETYADIDDLMAYTGFKPSTSLEDGLRLFVNWYRSYYGV
jgi:UDP-glucuronate 4-epimerase